MSTDAIAMPGTALAPRPIVARLHEWVTTVDHKRLGILYMIYALVFLLIAGVEAMIIRIQLIRPHNDFVSPQVFNRLFTMHGTTMIFFVIMPVMFGFANYLIPLMIGARDMGVSTSECFQLLDDRFRWPASLFQPGGSQRALRSGQRARRWVVRLRTADFADVFSWP
jgi:Cytochrome C and Quinol oxidase polypeptide I